MGPCVKCCLKMRNRNYGNVQEETVENHIADQENSTTVQAAAEP